MAGINAVDIPMVNHVLPTEILKKILGKLDFKSLNFAKQTCKHWKEIIVVFELVKHASSKLVDFCSIVISFLSF